MVSLRWQRIWALFDRCVALPSGERTAFLERECAGDGELVTAVRRLIDADRAGGYTEPPPLRQAADAARDESDPEVGRRLGPYRLERRIGAGGMGSVYLASRADEEFEQRVAVKLIKRGMDTDDILARFKNERQVLAQLEHPGIARLIDGGSTDDGRPYLVMEFVEGVPIDRYCDALRLGIRERIELFREICEAVHFAHTNQVVHRDLKPSNILVTPEGRPKLLDFGIAKVVDLTGSAHTVDVTMTELRLMTPEYASPEQVRGEPITTATDVYSLGVVLYELLTGRRPYRITTSLRADLERAVCEEDPPRPSSVAESGLRAELAGDLDNIVLMALRKEHELRYASVHQLSEDLGRHLASEPVVARPSTWRYVSARFLRRHRVAVTSAAAVLAALVAGLLVATVLYLEAEHARAVAEQREYSARLSAAALALRGFDVAQARESLEQAPVGLRGWEWRHLAGRLDRSAHTLLAMESVGSVGISADGLWAVAGGYEAEIDQIVLWRTSDWSEIRRWQAGSNIQSVAVAPDGSTVGAAVFGVGFQVWSVESDAPLQRWIKPGDRGTPPPVVFDGGSPVLVTGDIDGRVRLFDHESGEERPSFSDGSGAILGLSILDDGHSVLAVSADGVAIHDTRTGETSRRLALGHLERPRAGAHHPGRDLVALSAGEGMIYIWDAGGRLLREIRAHDLPILTLDFSPDGRRLASGSVDGTIRVWDAVTGERLALLLGHRDGVKRLAFLTDGRMLLSGSSDGTVRLWDSLADDVPTLKGRAAWCTTAVVLPDGRGIVSVGSGMLECFDLESRELLWRVEIDERDVYAAAVSPDGRAIATGSLLGTLELWTADGETRLWEVDTSETIRSVAFRPDGAQVAATSRSGPVHVRDATDGEIVLTLPGASMTVDVLWTPDGTRIMTADEASTLRSWAADTGRPIAAVSTSSYIADVACSADGRNAATACWDGTVRLWDVETLTELRVLEGHSARVHCVAFSPDGERLVSGSIDKTLKVWDLASGRMLATLYGHTSRVDSVAFTPDGSSVVSKATNGEIKIWDSLAP